MCEIMAAQAARTHMTYFFFDNNISITIISRISFAWPLFHSMTAAPDAFVVNSRSDSARLCVVVHAEDVWEAQLSYFTNQVDSVSTKAQLIRIFGFSPLIPIQHLY